MSKDVVATFLSKHPVPDVPEVPIKVETIHVSMAVGDVASGFATMFVNQLRGRDPLAYDRFTISETELEDYVAFLLDRRIRFTIDQPVETLQLRRLWIPDFVQCVLSTVGRVTIKERSLTLLPASSPSRELISIDEAFQISEKLSMFRRHFGMLQDAFPRQQDGDLDVMSVALIKGCILSQTRLSHPVKAFLGAFCDGKIDEKFLMLYRYDYGVIEDVANSIRYAPTLC